MQIKTIRPINFLFFRTLATIPELAKHLSVAPELFKEAAACNLWVTGPVHWHYLGFTGDPDAPFTLEISLPVAAIPSDYDGRFHFKRTQPFNCVSSVHEGPWLQMGETYARVMSYMSENGLIPSGVNRELYVNVDFEDSDANTTEVQVGIIKSSLKTHS